MKDHQEAHGSREIMFCLSGEHFYGFRGKVRKVGPGTVMLIEKGDSHDAIYSPHQPPCRDLWLHLSVSHSFGVNDVRITPKEGGDSITQRFYLVSHSRVFIDSVHLAWNRLNDSPADVLRYHQLQSTVASILMETLLYGVRPPASIRKEAQQRVVVEEIKRFIRSNLAQKLSLGMLAEMAGYDPVYFHRLFSRHAGEPILQFINRERLKCAQAMLLDGYKIVSISDALGFASASYFCRFFKRETQHTPSAWLVETASGKGGSPPS